MADPVIEPVTVSEVTSGDYEGTIFVGDSVDGIADGTLITGSGGADLDVMFVLVSGYLVSTLRSFFSIYTLLFQAEQCMYVSEGSFCRDQRIRSGARVRNKA